MQPIERPHCMYFPGPNFWITQKEKRKCIARTYQSRNYNKKTRGSHWSLLRSSKTNKEKKE